MPMLLNCSFIDAGSAASDRPWPGIVSLATVISVALHCAIRKDGYAMIFIDTLVTTTSGYELGTE